MPTFNSSTNPVELMRFGVDYKFKLRLRNFEITFRPLSSLETINIESDSRQHLLQMKEHQQLKLQGFLIRRLQRRLRTFQ
jgi:hypothetical protein